MSDALGPNSSIPRKSMGRLRALASNAILENGEDERLQKMTKFSTIFDNFLTSLSKKLLAQLKSRQELQLLLESAVGRFESKTIISKTTTSGCASSSGILEPGFEPTKPFYRS